MDDTETCNVSGTLATVLRVSSALGLAPLRFSPLRSSTLPLRAPSLRPQQNRSPGHFGYNISVSRKRARFGCVLSLVVVHVTIDLLWIIRQIMQLLVTMQFVFIVCTVNATIRVLNDQLRSLIYKLKLYGSMKTKSVTNAHITTRRLCRAYMSICELVRSIDQGEGALMFSLLLGQILNIMCAILLLNSSINLGEMSFNEMIHFGIVVGTFLYKAASVVLVVEPCHNTRQEFQETQNLVSDLMCASYEREFREELSRYHDQFVYNMPAFAPLGVCVLSRQFMVAVVGSIATFLTIILQFRIKHNAPVSINN